MMMTSLPSSPPRGNQIPQQYLMSITVTAAGEVGIFRCMDGVPGPILIFNSSHEFSGLCPMVAVLRVCSQVYIRHIVIIILQKQSAHS